LVFRVSGWNDLSFLVHGFGTRLWNETHFRRDPVLSRFRLVSLRQVHSDIIHRVDVGPKERLTGDALMTDRPGLLLSIRTADCLPVLYATRKPSLVAAAHCGWKGTLKGLAGRMVKVLEKEYRVSPAELSVALGPCIGRQCYEVGEELRKSFSRSGFLLDAFRPHPVRERKYFLDLRGENRRQLQEAGVPPRNIFSVTLCTHCRDELLSYRRNPGTRERMWNFIGLLPG